MTTLKVCKCTTLPGATAGIGARVCASASPIPVKSSSGSKRNDVGDGGGEAGSLVLFFSRSDSVGNMTILGGVLVNKAAVEVLKRAGNLSTRRSTNFGGDLGADTGGEEEGERDFVRRRLRKSSMVHSSSVSRDESGSKSTGVLTMVRLRNDGEGLVEEEEDKRVKSDALLYFLDRDEGGGLAEDGDSSGASSGGEDDKRISNA